MNRKGSTLLNGFLVLGILTVPAFAQRSDDQVQEAIEKGLKKEKINLFVEVRGGSASLEGRVRNVFAKDKAIAIAFEPEEIEDVDATDIEISTAESEKKLGEEVIKQVRRYGNLTVFDDAGAIIKDGNVVLTGFVTEPYKKTGIEERLYKVLGIQAFENQIKVLPNNQQDVRLRRNLANRLYRDPIFSDFARMAHPPVRIIVERAKVLLTGVVNSQLAYQKAETIMRQTPGVLSVENRLRIGS